MHSILAVTLPFFALVLCGWYGAKRHVLPESAIPGLNAFVLYFALPCLLFRFGMNTPIAQLVNPTILLLWFGCAVVMVGVTIGLTRGPKVPLKDASLGALVAAFPNSGFLGVPLLVALLGESAAGPLICTILVDLLFTTSFCVGLAHAHPTAPQPERARRPLRRAVGSRWSSFSRSDPPTTLPTLDAMGDPTDDPADDPAERPTLPGVDPASVASASSRSDARAAMVRALKGALSNPMPWAIAAGALCSLARVKPFGPVDAVISMLADAASPVALFTIGAVLWRAGQHVRSRTPMSRVLPVVALKLLLHPLLVLMAALAARRLGAPLPLDVITVLVLAAALPSASNVSILAERFGADNGRIARIIMLSTALSVVTFSALAWLFDVRPRV